MHWTIQEVASSAGISSRTLRHYDAIGLLTPAGIGYNGHRHYGEAELLRLQQILAFRELGVGLADIGAILDAGADPVEMLERLAAELGQSIERLQRQRESIRRALHIHRTGEQLMPAEIFDGFEYAQYQDEVEERWGADAYASGDAWWRGMPEADRAAWHARSQSLIQAWTDAADRGIAPDSDEAQQLAARQNAWLAGIPGTPGAGTGQAASEYLLGLAQLYVDDDRFGMNYGGRAGAEFVAAALRVYVDRRDEPSQA